MWQHAAEENQRHELQAKAAAYKGRSGAALDLDGVSTDLVAHWNRDKQRITIELRSYFDNNATYLRLDGTGNSAGKSASSTRKDGWFPKAPEIVLPVSDPLADVTVRVAAGGKDWKEGSRAPSQTVRLSPTGIAYDADTGQRLKSDLD
ncbi:hypothetical protein [Streptomyces sp. WAC06614]|uniref:hypothetical protein n=1 Tax=Streptomyces sp. WAC06614 TaxID=2487416 RepID=UPI000F78532D|nr:hypothetical protein [Streptomyces sp. WAC06614]RSS79409.1 hypothetical protein EF918_17445 [Streptomyces sp. WAC06614]